MIASDRVRLDGLIHQDIERIVARLDFVQRVIEDTIADGPRATTKHQLERALRALRISSAALLVLGDARPHPQEP